MDLFHAITTGIDQVLTCHWYDELKNFNSKKMSDNKKMDTEPGGESTQYESIKTQTVPPAKQRGQLGGDMAFSGGEQGVSKERAEKTAENIRYGQGISEQGFGGKTTTSTGETQQGGYGGVQADQREEDIKAGASRRQQGYEGGSGVGG